jgi:hypothetical protein
VTKFSDIKINMFYFYQKHDGGVAHMVERSLRMREARGSIPRTSKSGLSLVGGIKFFAFFYRLRGLVRKFWPSSSDSERRDTEGV